MFLWGLGTPAIGSGSMRREFCTTHQSGRLVLMSFRYHFGIYKHLDFYVARGGALVGFWVAGMGLEILPKTIALTQLNFSPIGPA